MNRDKEHLIKQKCRENVIGFAPFRYRFSKGSAVREGLLNIGKFKEDNGENLVLTFIFDSDNLQTDSDIHDRLSHLKFNPIMKKGLLTALRNSAEFEENENFAMHEFNFYFDKMPANLEKLMNATMIPFFMEHLPIKIGKVEWMKNDEGLNFFCILKSKLNL
ncbi:hypothetical protein [Maridesulfovibrio ferrireducens]|uniref:hypothetical protein n=1 Tax=Maridesulfovibrio ferrireducens TaxID=246191 RepID=UPI001A2CBB20|nr:hypothetical protein [Maridesulfovibrio ferrireducens]MBI9109846.1 hypothetical protein [Maridesulfovibrio ferrireducens]